MQKSGEPFCFAGLWDRWVKPPLPSAVEKVPYPVRSRASVAKNVRSLFGVCFALALFRARKETARTKTQAEATLAWNIKASGIKTSKLPILFFII
jgi:hypothetical protein